VLTGHVIASMVQALLALAAVTAVALLVGFRPTATALEWLAAVGVMLLVSFALTWVAVALGLVATTVETASNLPMPLILLPFLSSGFVPTDTMPAGLRWFAEYQPFTPIMETLRGLLLGTAIGSSGLQAVGWCAVISVGCFIWAKRLYNRPPSR
jgi:ABC-2 type transport system permease protein